jgi:hypothetical protein
MGNRTQQLATTPLERSADLYDCSADPDPDRHDVQPGVPDVHDAAKPGCAV